VVISSFNAARFLPAALDSVLGQSMADLEVVLVDDASTDDTAAVLGRYTDARLQVLRNEQNLGPFASANRALQKASGTFIARLDADDVCFPHRLAVQLEVFDAQPQVGLLGSQCERIDEQGRPKGLQPVPEGDLAIRLRCLVAPPFVHSTVMWRRALDLRYDETMRVAGDFELWTRALELTRAANVMRPLVQYRESSTGITATQGVTQRRLHDAIAAGFCRRQWPALGLDEGAVRALRDWCSAGEAQAPLPSSLARVVEALQREVLGPAPSRQAVEVFARAIFTAPGAFGQPATRS